VTQRNAHTRKQLFDTEWFGQIVICPVIERGDFITFVVFYRKNDDGDLRPFTQARADFNAVDIGQAQIENDNIGRIGRGQREPFFAAVGNCDLKFLFGQNRPQGTQDLRFVINDEDMGGITHIVSESAGR
jgi:hypothetical protein